MDYRDWGQGDFAPHERKPDDDWALAPKGGSAAPRRAGRHRKEELTTDASAHGWPTGGWPRPENADSEPLNRSTESLQDFGGGRHTDDTGEWRRPTDWAPRTRADEWGDETQHHGWSHTSTETRDLLDTGQWDRFTDTGEWAQVNDWGATDDWTDPNRDDARQADSGHHSGTDLAPHWSDTFWTGTRLAGDDPRWMPTPASAPKSPPVNYSPMTTQSVSPASQHDAPAATPDDSPLIPTHGTAPDSADRWETAPEERPFPAVHRANLSAVTRRRASHRADDPSDDNPGGPFSAMLYAVAWYTVPLVIFAFWILMLDGKPPADCLAAVAGAGCESERDQAISTLAAGMPRFGVAFAASLVIAALLRKVVTSWRAASVGFAAAVISGGFSTVLISAISG